MSTQDALETSTRTDFLSLTEAARYLGISRDKLWRLTKSGVVQSYQSALNRRVKLYRVSEIKRLMVPDLVQRNT